jgi:hypothetical protein
MTRLCLLPKAQFIGGLTHKAVAQVLLALGWAPWRARWQYQRCKQEFMNQIGR